MKGKARTKLLDHSSGLVEGLSSGSSWEFLYQHSSVRHPDYQVGDRVALPDGRVFRYAKAAGTMNPDCLAQHETGQYIGYVALGASQAVGDKEVTLTVVAASTGSGGAGVIAKDEMRGGYVLIFDASSKAIQRGIIGNSALAATGTSITLYLDGGVERALLATTDHAEAIASPYLDLIDGDAVQSKTRGFLGLPTCIATDGEYFWVQTWGPCWVAPDNGNSATDLGNTDYSLQAVARFDGHVAAHIYNDGETPLSQHVGFVLSRGAGAAQGAPFLMLQISP